MRRNLYFFEGKELQVGSQNLPAYHSAALRPEQEVELAAPAGPVRLFLLQGVPIAEPIAQYGPFVMNTNEEISQAFEDYRRTEFGGWPWRRSDPVFSADKGRFARYADGSEEVR